MSFKTALINCLPAPSRTPNENSNFNPEVGARCRQAVTSLCLAQEMTADEFWNIIEESRASFQPDRVNGNMDEQEKLLARALKKRRAEEIGEFAAWFNRMTNASYRYDLWTCAHIVSGGCSDDSFFYFRCWMVSMGEEAHGRMLEDADNLGDYAQKPGVEDIFFEEIFHVPHDVFRKKTGEDGIPSRFFDGGSYSDPEDKKWSFDDLIAIQTRFPKTWNSRCCITWPNNESEQGEDDQAAAALNSKL